jgi:N-dimethylarginine dimethylaminohydrolase
MKILRVSPDYFAILYAINPHMKVGSVDGAKAAEQWEALGGVYEKIGAELFVLPGQPGYPDMVFCANQSLPFERADGSKAVILSNMANPERSGEVVFFEQWFLAHGYELVKLPPDLTFEGMGDFIYSADRAFLWAGIGPRTTEVAHRAIEHIIGKPVRSLELAHPDFYHLDTCLAIVDAETAVFYRPAFTEEGALEILRNHPRSIEVTEEEAYRFACNLHCLDQKFVVIPEGCPRLEGILKERGFEVYGVDTSEYLKSGGSVFCMKLDLE